jgi:YD repeat-containing protein
VGRQVSFDYAASNSSHNTTVTDVEGGITTYGYRERNHLTTITEPLDSPTAAARTLTNTYNADCEIIEQDDPGEIMRYSHGPGATTITDPEGHVVVARHRRNLLTSLTRGAGSTEEATWSFAHDTRTMGVTRATDPNGRASTTTYDAAANVLSSTDPLSRTSTFTYDPATNRRKTAKDPDGVTTTYGYSGANLTSVSTPLSTTVTATTTYG